ncbi:MAG: hypothetical protein IJ789_01460 [Bacteroidales bacterium]|nr:hypothetical protein [Bacteroidales bacterium]
MKPYKVLIFIALSIALLGVLCWFFPTSGVEAAGITLRMPTLARVMGQDSTATFDVEAYLAAEESPELQGLRDSVEYLQRAADSADTRFYLPTDDYFDSLFALFERAQAEGRTVRVLHYGDSQIEMDRMSARLRAILQHRFGGSGPGLIPFRTIISSPAVNISASGDLSRYAPFGDSTVHRSRQGHYGPMMQDFHLAGQAQTTISAARSSRVDSLLGSFQQVTLLANNRGGRFSAGFGNRQLGLDTTFATDSTGPVAFGLRLDSATTAIRVSANGQGDLYGLLVDGMGGVAVDNIPMRGCSGQQFTMVDSTELAQAYAMMDIGLIIMQFGGNSVPYLRSRKPVETYCRSIGRQIERVRACCPRAKILFVGPSDMSTSVEGRYQSYPYLDSVVEALRLTALEHGAAYWSIYHAMGGHNTMVAWVENGLGSQDHIHFSQRGADIMGDRLGQAFMDLYTLYGLRQRIVAEEQKNTIQ